jgi:hypothetical protein
MMQSQQPASFTSKLYGSPLVRMASSDKLIASQGLNRVGAQVLRMVVAHGIHRLVRKTAPDQVRQWCQSLEREGFLFLEDFLPGDAFAAIRDSSFALMADSQVRRTTYKHGSTRVDHLDLLALDAERGRVFQPWLNDERIPALLGWAERRRVSAAAGFPVIERVRYGVSDEHDQENDLHSDTFFPTHKLWLYLQDVDEARGPLVFVPRSHGLSVGRVFWEYQNSVGQRQGARRITDDELRALGLSERSMSCRANTLVVANTCGYHRRSPGAFGQERLSLQMSFRTNPFLPHGLRH